MLTWEAARQAIYSRFITEWADQLDFFIEGQQDVDMQVQVTPFVRLCVEPTRIQQIAMLGFTPPLRSFGTVEVTVFVPMSVGARTRMTAIDTLIEIFAAQTVGEVIFRDVNVLSLIDGKDWRSQTVIANFFFEHQTGA